MTYSPTDLYTLAELHHRDPGAALRIADESAREADTELDALMKRALESSNSLAKELRECRMAAMAVGEIRRIG